MRPTPQADARTAQRPGLILATAEEWVIFCGALPVLGRLGLGWLQHKIRPVPWLRVDGPNQVWSWCISYLPTSVKGIWLYLHLAMDGGAGRWWPGMWRTGKPTNLLSILLAALVRESGSRDDAIGHYFSMLTMAMQCGQPPWRCG